MLFSSPSALDHPARVQVHARLVLSEFLQFSVPEWSPFLWRQCLRSLHGSALLPVTYTVSKHARAALRRHSAGTASATARNRWDGIDQGRRKGSNRSSEQFAERDMELVCGGVHSSWRPVRSPGCMTSTAIPHWKSALSVCITCGLEVKGAGCREGLHLHIPFPVLEPRTMSAAVAAEQQASSSFFSQRRPVFAYRSSSSPVSLDGKPNQRIAFATCHFQYASRKSRRQGTPVIPAHFAAPPHTSRWLALT